MIIFTDKTRFEHMQQIQEDHKDLIRSIAFISCAGRPGAQPSGVILCVSQNMGTMSKHLMNFAKDSWKNFIHYCSAHSVSLAYLDVSSALFHKYRGKKINKMIKSEGNNVKEETFLEIGELFSKLEKACPDLNPLEVIEMLRNGMESSKETIRYCENVG